MDDKLALRLNDWNIGYLPMNASVQGASTVHKATRPNMNESFFISHDRGPDHPEVTAAVPLRGLNQWPPALPDIRQPMTTYFKTLGAMCDRMLPAFAAALDMPADSFAPLFANDGHHNLRFLHYPPQDADEDNLFGQAPHTDNSFMTALARTEVPGLAVRLPSGEWFPPPIIQGTFLINLGNMMRRFSNDRFLSTPHGVLNESGTDRYSIAYFHSPEPERDDRMPAELRLAPTIRRATSRRSTVSWCWTSTAPITFTRKATNRTPRSSRPPNNICRPGESRDPPSRARDGRGVGPGLRRDDSIRGN